MDANRLNRKFLKEKRKLRLNYKGYDLEKILAMDLVSEIYLNPPLKLKTIRYFFLAFDFNYLKNKCEEATLFSMGRYFRKDYYEILNYVQSTTKESVFFDFSQIKPIPSFNIPNVIFACKHIFKNTGLPFKSKLFLSSQLSFYLNTIAKLEDTGPIFKNYCAFSGIHHLEAILTFYFKKTKKTTYTLQHGIYYIFRDNIPLDAIIYENFLSDIQLCWGQYTADEFIDYGISKDSLVVAGYPRKLFRQKPHLLNKTKCVVLLARYTYEDSNISLISILKQFSNNFNVNISLKLHPSLNWSFYNELCHSLGWELIQKDITLTDVFQKENFGWAIAVNTASYYEAYLNYLPCLRYNDGTFEDSINVFQDNFASLEQLKTHFKNIPFENKNRLNAYFDLADKRLKYVLGLGINRYSILNN